MSCCFFWSANSLAIKFTTDHLPPIGSAGLRFGIGLLPVTVWALLSGVSLRPRKEDWPVLLFHGAILFVQIALLNWGTARTEAARSTVLLTAHAVFVALLAPLVAGGERLTARRFIGFAICAAGLLAVFADQLGAWRRDILTGDAMVLGSSFLLGFKIAHVKRSIVAVDPCRLLFWQAMIAIPMFMMYSLLFEGLDAYQWRLTAVLALGYQGFFVTGFCFICWTIMLKRHDAASLAVYGFTTPLFGVALSIALRPGERATLPLLLGAVLVAGGIVLATTGRSIKRVFADHRS